MRYLGIIYRWLNFPRLLEAITALSVFVFAFNVPLDIDTFWHLRSGEWQVTNGAILHVDVFSSTYTDAPWLNVYWLAQLLFYGAYALQGEWGIAILTGLLAVAGMAIVAHACETGPIERAFIIVLTGSAAKIFWPARPQMFSFLFSAVVVYILWLFQKRGINRLWVIPVLMIPWANMHLGFSIGLILIGLAIIGEAAYWGIRRFKKEGNVPGDAPTFKPVAQLVLAAAACIVAILINPYGVDTLLHPFQTLGIGVLRDSITEWLSPDFHNPRLWPFALLLLGVPVIIGLSSRRLDIRDAVMLAGTGLNALLAGRNISVFSVAVAPIFAIHLTSLLGDLGIRAAPAGHPTRGYTFALNWLILFLIMGGTAIYMVSLFQPDKLAATRREGLPIEGVAALRETDPHGRLFNAYEWGGYLIWAARDFPVFVDGRTDLYGDDFLREYLRTYYAQPGWQAYLNRWNIETILIETKCPLAQVLLMSDDWTRIHRDDLSSLFVRKTY